MKKHKFYNKSKGTGYVPFEKLSPYSKISSKRLKKVKFSFKKANEYVKKYSKKPKSWLDVGTANGEFIHFASKQWKKTNFIGLDITKEFIERAKKINEKSKNVSFFLGDALK